MAGQVEPKGLALVREKITKAHGMATVEALFDEINYHTDGAEISFPDLCQCVIRLQELGEVQLANAPLKGVDWSTQVNRVTPAPEVLAARDRRK